MTEQNNHSFKVPSASPEENLLLADDVSKLNYAENPIPFDSLETRALSGDIGTQSTNESGLIYKKRDPRKAATMEDLENAIIEAQSSIDKNKYGTEEDYMMAQYEYMRQQSPELFESMGPEFSAGLKMYREQRVELQREV